MSPGAVCRPISMHSDNRELDGTRIRAHVNPPLGVRCLYPCELGQRAVAILAALLRQCLSEGVAPWVRSPAPLNREAERRAFHHTQSTLLPPGPVLMRA